VEQNLSLGRSCQNSSADLINGSPTGSQISHSPLLTFSFSFSLSLICPGAVRISVGYMTSSDDCERFLRFLVLNFLNKASKTLHIVQPPPTEPSPPTLSSPLSSSLTATLTAMFIYPIKSCAGTSIHHILPSPSVLLCTHSPLILAHRCRCHMLARGCVWSLS
jgi:hypothetical protein